MNKISICFCFVLKQRETSKWNPHSFPLGLWKEKYQHKVNASVSVVTEQGMCCKWEFRGFPGGSVVKNLHTNAETGVQSLIQKDSRCHGATQPIGHNYWASGARAQEPQLSSLLATTTEARCPQACASQQKKPLRSLSSAMKTSPHSLQLEKSPCSNKDPAQPKINKFFIFLKRWDFRNILFSGCS